LVDYLLGCVNIAIVKQLGVIIKMSTYTTQQQVYLFLAQLSINPAVPAQQQMQALKLQTKMGTYAQMQLDYVVSEEEFVAVWNNKATKNPLARLR
tara:strand:- start:168 stop:452 length:285 start_codon:yes stop_codon:yes gene_type:complete